MALAAPLIAVVSAVIVMLLAAEPLSRFIGHAAMGFSAFVESLNMISRRRKQRKEASAAAL